MKLNCLSHLSSLSQCSRSFNNQDFFKIVMGQNESEQIVRCPKVGQRDKNNHSGCPAKLSWKYYLFRYLNDRDIRDKITPYSEHYDWNHVPKPH